MYKYFVEILDPQIRELVVAWLGAIKISVFVDFVRAYARVEFGILCAGRLL